MTVRRSGHGSGSFDPIFAPTRPSEPQMLAGKRIGAETSELQALRLSDSLVRLGKRLGGAAVSALRGALREGRFDEVARGLCAAWGSWSG